MPLNRQRTEHQPWTPFKCFQRKEKFQQFLLGTANLGLNTVKHPRVDVVRADDRRLDVLGMALGLELDAEGIVQADGGELGAAVVDELVGPGVAGQAGDVDDVTLLVGNHVGKEGFDQPEMGKHVHVKRFNDFGCNGKL